MNKKGKILGYAVFVILIIFLYFSLQESSLVNQEVGTKIFAIKKGEGLKEISEGLEGQGLILDSKLFQLYAFLRNARTKFLPGEYHLDLGTSFKELVKILTSQPLAPERTITIVEGLTNKEIAELLQGQEIVSKDDFFATLDEISQDQEIIDKYEFLSDITLNDSSEEKLQGFLFPDTYRFYKETSAKAIVKKMLENFDKKINNSMRTKIEESGRTIHEIIILASIVEKEAALDQDRRLIADIFWKRLAVNWALQSDATINYILNSSKLQPTFEDTRSPSLYNTYLHPGLPPGPINNPSLSAISATINPIENDYCCFLTAPEGNNIFSKTIEEHNRNKAIYLK